MALVWKYFVSFIFLSAICKTVGADVAVLFICSKCFEIRNALVWFRLYLIVNYSNWIQLFSFHYFLIHVFLFLLLGIISFSLTCLSPLFSSSFIFFTTTFMWFSSYRDTEKKWWENVQKIVKNNNIMRIIPLMSTNSRIEAKKKKLCCTSHSIFEHWHGMPTILCNLPGNMSQ